MPDRALITESNLTDIANAIRTKSGTLTTYLPSEMAAAINAIPSGGIVDVEVVDDALVFTEGDPPEPTGVSGVKGAMETSYRDGYVNITPANIGAAKIVKVTTTSFSSLSRTFYDSSITSTMEVISAKLSNPSAQTGDWTVTTSSGSFTISGSISGSTTATIYFTTM